ncbi:hypothetical protein [Dietzia aurantiaca]|uniref:Uncharacterized protein n=1 Tax=Dietzia aurantiaca TaxID=983873 RepID=A0ABV9PRH2_9ACTN
MTDDWLLKASRHRHASDRLLAVASSLIVEKEIVALDVFTTRALGTLLAGDCLSTRQR